MIKSKHLVQTVIVIATASLCVILYFLIVNGDLVSLVSSLPELSSEYDQAIESENTDKIVEVEKQLLVLGFKVLHRVVVYILLTCFIFLGLLLFEILRIEGDEYNLDRDIF